MISVVVVTRNRLALLKKTIESIMKQTFKDFECIVVDDGSTDGTREYCEASPLKYFRICPEDSRGGNYARNIGVKLSTGQYIAFCDDDDYWMPTKLEKQMSLMQEKKCGLVYCLRTFERHDGENVTYWNEPHSGKPQGNIAQDVFCHHFTSTSTLLVKKTLLEQINGFDENLKMWQEYDLIIRLAQLTEIYYVSECLVVYYSGSGLKRLSNSDYAKFPKTEKYFRTKYKKELCKIGLKQKFLFYDMIVCEYFNRSKNAGIKHIYCPLWLWAFSSRIFHKIIFLLNKRRWKEK